MKALRFALTLSAVLLLSTRAMAQCPVITVSPATLANATADQVYSPVAFSASPAGSYTFEATGLPTGLTMSAGGSLSGTPTQTGTFAVRTVATSAANCVATHTIPLTVVCPTISFTPATMPNGIVGVAYPNQTLVGSGGTAPYTFAVTSGSLPPGLTLVGNTVSGTPTTATGSPFGFTITATDANSCTVGQPYTVAIGSCPTITVTNPAVVNGTSGSPYTTAAFTQTGATTPSFTVASGTLPTGLSLNSSSGIISGTPTQTGTFVITVRATETTGANTGCSGTGGTYTFQICPVITVTNPAVVNGTSGSPYTTAAFTQTGATTPSFTIASGSLPTGLSLNSGTGIISGTPTQTGTFTVTVRATETTGGTTGCFGTGGSYTFQICPVITVTNPAVVNGTSGSPYTTAAFTQSGATTPSFTIASGSLPTGLTLNAGTGIISGTPTQTGTFTVTVRATETAAGGTNGCSGVGGSYTFQICPVITVTNPAVANGVTGSPYTTAAFTQTGATTPSFTIASGTLPTGLTLNAGTGIISGTPTQTGSFTVTVRATETAVGGTTGCFGTGSSYIFKICPVISVTNPSRVDGVANTVYAGATFTQTGVTTPSFTIASGSLPTGITLNAGTGALAGTPTTTGTFTITVRATETAAGGTNGCFADGTSYTFQICPQITIARTGGGSFPDPLYQQSYTGQSFTASGGTGPYTFAVTVGSLPTGLSLASNGALSGTPTTTGAFTFTVTATSSGGSPVCTGSQAFTFTARPNTVGDTYLNGVGNTQYVIAGYTPFPGTPAVSNAATVIANDVYPGSPTPANLVVSGAPTHGVVTLKTDGTFLYTPNVGDATGSDAFTYTLTDTNGITNTATVAVNWSGMVWYVNHGNAAATHDGRSHAPFLDFGAGLGNFGSATTQTGNTIFVHTGSATTTGTVTLLATQRLWGNGVAFALNGLSIAAGTKPTMNGTATLANGVTVTGITFNPTGAISALTGSALTGTVTIDQNTISANNAATAVNLQTGTANINFTATSIAQSGAGTGLVVNGKTAGTVSFDSTSPISVTGAGATGINLTGNGGATINFAGTLTLTTTTGPAFVATGGGTVTATAAGGVVSTTTATAVNVANTTIGAGGITFQSVSVAGNGTNPTKGIVLNNTGAGAFIVTGTGSTGGSGGTVQSIAQRGAEIITASNISLKNMNFTNADANDGGTCTDLSTAACNAAVYLSGVSTITLDNVAISGSAQEGINGLNVSNFTLSNSTISNCGNAVEEGCVKMRQLTGTCSITGSNLSFPGADVVEIVNSALPALALNVSGSTFRDSQASGSGNTGLQVRSEGTSSTVLNVANSTFLRIRTVGVHATAINSASSDVDITTSTFDPDTGTMIGIDLDADNTGSLVFNVQNNVKIYSKNGPAVNVFGDTSATIQGRISNNPDVQVKSNAPASNVGSGIRANVNKDASAKIEVQNNVVNVASDDAGIDLTGIGRTSANPGGATNTLDATVKNNSVTIGATSTYGIFLISASNASDTNAICVNVANNSVTRNPSSIASLRARVPSASGFFRMQGFVTNAEATWNATGNTPTSSGGSEVSFGGAGTFAGCTAVLPTNPGPN